MALTLPDPHQMESLKDRALRGKDLLFLRQWMGLSIADCCYLLGMPVVRWHFYQKHPDRLIDDAGVALLARALLTHPEAHFLPRFPEFAEVEPAFRRALQQSAHPLPDPDTALGLLLGRDRSSVERWRRGTGQRQIPPPVRRLLLVLHAVLADHGAPGFESLIERAALEAAARGFDLDSPAMITWTRRAPYRRLRGRSPKSPPPVAEPATVWLPPLPDAGAVSPPLFSPLFSPPGRPMTGRDVVALQRRLQISRADLRYLLGHPVDSWGDDAPTDDHPLPDPAVALLVWALTRFPDLPDRYLPAFPAPAAVFAHYRDLAAPLGSALPVHPPTAGRGAFSLLLGREIKTASSWLAAGRREPPPPLASRLLFAVGALLTAHGAAGLAAWIARATLEAAARGVDLRTATAWTRRSDPVPASADAGDDDAGHAKGNAESPRDLDARPACGRDAGDLCRALDVSAADGAYLLGVSPLKLRECLDRPGQMIDDPAVALLVWLLLAYPETHFLTPFPAPAAVYPPFLEAAAVAAAARPLLARCPSGPAAFGVLLGRSRAHAQRWLATTDAPPAPPPVARLSFALRWLLKTHGAAGLAAWVDQVEVEAGARGLDPAATASWEPVDAPEPAAPPPTARTLTAREAQPPPPGVGLKRPRGRPRKPPPDATEPRG